MAQKIKCHICASKMGSDYPLQHCARCGADLVNIGVESVLRKAHGGFVPSGGKTRQGMVYLTNWRLFVVPDVSFGGAAAFGLIGAAVGSAIQSTQSASMPLNISLADVVGVDEEKITAFAKGLSIISRTYGAIGIVSVPQRDQWRDAIMQAAMTSR